MEYTGLSAIIPGTNTAISRASFLASALHPTKPRDKKLTIKQIPIPKLKDFFMFPRHILLKSEQVQYSFI